MAERAQRDHGEQHDDNAQQREGQAIAQWAALLEQESSDETGRHDDRWIQGVCDHSGIGIQQGRRLPQGQGIDQGRQPDQQGYGPAGVEKGRRPVLGEFFYQAGGQVAHIDGAKYENESKETGGEDGHVDQEQKIVSGIQRHRGVNVEEVGDAAG